jgi:hypothetical protein
LLTGADFLVLRWLGVRFALTARTHLRAAGLTFATLMGLPWLAFVLVFFARHSVFRC